MNCAPFDMLKFFDAEDGDDLEIIEIAGMDREWIEIEEPFFPDATLIVVLWKKGVHYIAVRYEERIAEFDVYKTILRDDDSQIAVDREPGKKEK